MQSNDIKLNMHMESCSFAHGSSKELSKNQADSYVSRVDMILPNPNGVIPEGVHTVEYNGMLVEIHISTIKKPTEDPIYIRGKDHWLGASGSGFDQIPFSAFTDNRGQYPATLANFIFPERIATWVDETEPTGRKSNTDYERLQVTGSPDNEEKVICLLVLQKLFKSIGIEGKYTVRYDDVSAFNEMYFKKGNNRSPVYISTHVLEAKDAYKKGVYDYILPRFESAGVSNDVQNFISGATPSDIQNESDLLHVVKKAIEEVLKFHIEDRRWIDPFWDGQRKIKHNDEKIVVPRTPKSETHIQPTLHVILDMALTPLGIHVVRESDEGVGLLDFKFLFTSGNTPLSVAVEFKIAHHKKIKHGLTKQLPKYLRAIRSNSGLFRSNVV